MSSRVVKNTLYLVLALVGQKFIAFVYFTILARALKVEEIGLYSTAVSLSLIFSIFVDLGLTSVLIRDLSALRSREGDHTKEENQIIGNTLGVKIFLAILAYIILYISVRAAGYPSVLVRLSWISGVIMIFDSLHITLYGIMRAYGNLRYEAYGMVFGQLCVFFAGIIVLIRHMPFSYFLIVLVLGSVFNVIWSASMIRLRYNIKLAIYFSLPRIKLLLVSAVPFALAGIFVKIYSFVDSLVLARIAGIHAVGLYSIPYKLAFAFQFIPLALVAALYPAMSSAYAENKGKLKELFEQSMIYVGISAMFIAAMLIVVARPLIHTLYGTQYLPGVSTLQVLAFTLVFTFLGYPVGSLLNASRKQHIQTIFIGITAVLNISLNFFLIPYIGILGAALAAFVSNIFLTYGGYKYAPRIIGLPTTHFLRSMTKIYISGIIAVGGGYLLAKPLLILTRLPLGEIVYVSGLAFITALILLFCLYISNVLNFFVLKDIIAILRAKKESVEPFKYE